MWMRVCSVSDNGTLPVHLEKMGNKLYKSKNIKVSEKNFILECLTRGNTQRK